MKIAITHPYAWPEVRRGAERIVVEISRALARAGHEVVVFTSGRDAGRTEEEGVLTVKFRQTSSRPRLHELAFAARLAPALVRGRFDATHSFMPYDVLACCRTARLGGHRTIYHEMGVPWLVWSGRYDEAARVAVAERVDVYGCMSEYALGELRAHGDREGVRIPGGVRMGQFRPVVDREEAPTVLFSGAFDVPFKGVSTLLEAVGIASETIPDLRLWLSGPGEGTVLDGAPQRARELTTILPLGSPDEQPRRYSSAWVTAQPSIRESFGMAMLESLACGTPLVVSDDGALKELVTEGTGAVTAAGDSESLAAGLVDAIELARDPATAGRCREFAAAYDWDEGMVPLLESLYVPGPRR